MNKITISIIAILLSCVAPSVMAAECQGLIKGLLVNKEGEPVEGAYIFVVGDTTKQSVVANAYSNENGVFTMEVPCGDRVMCISHIGYKLVHKDVCVSPNDTVDLGVCTMEDDMQELQTVIVKGNAVRVKTKADGFLVDARDIAKSSNNALDLLGRLPQIRVKENDIRVIGKENVLLRVNNVMQRVSKDELADVLRGYSAALISSVEVITSPPLKYDSDGTTAMIVLHMDSKFNRYVGGNAGTELMKGARYNGRYAVYGSGIFNNETLFVDVTPSCNHNYSYLSEQSEYIYDNGDFYLNNNPSRGDNDYFGAYATVQYQYSKRGYLGFNVNVNKRNIENIFTSQEIFTDKQAFNNNNIDINRPRMNGTIYAEHAFSESFKGWLEIACYNYKETTDQAFDGYENDSQNPSMTYMAAQKLKVDGVTLSNDYTVDLGNKLNFDFGFKAHFAHISNFRSNKLIQPDISTTKQDDRIALNEIKLNPYVSTTYRPTEKMHFRLGVQLANSNRKISGEAIQDNSLSDTYLLPDFIASWKPSSSSRLSLNITSGSTEPKFVYINPFVWRINQNSYQSGNTGLKSEKNYTYKFIYTYKGNLSVTEYVKQKMNEIRAVGMVVDGAVLYVAENVQNTVEYGFRPSYYFDRSEWVEFSVDGYWGFAVSKGLIPEVSEKTTSMVWGGSAFASFVFNKQRTFTGYVSCDYTGHQKTAVSSIDPMVDVGAGISWYLLDRKLCFSLSGINIFSSSYKGKSERNGHTVVFDNKIDYPTLYLSVTYLFNNIKDSTPRRHKMVRSIEQRL